MNRVAARSALGVWELAHSKCEPGLIAIAPGVALSLIGADLTQSLSNIFHAERYSVILPTGKGLANSMQQGQYH